MEIKLQASLPAGVRQQAEFVRQRILVDTRGWRDPAESITCLPVLLDALWRQARFWTTVGVASISNDCSPMK